MRARALLAVLPVLALAGCGGAKIVAPKPVTVIGSVPTQTAPATTSTTTGGGATTTSGGQTTGGGGGASGKALFVANGCGHCHTLQPAGSNAKIGPDLDNIKQYATQAKQPLDKFAHESIVNPKAYVQPGFQP